MNAVLSFVTCSIRTFVRRLMVVLVILVVCITLDSVEGTHLSAKTGESTTYVVDSTLNTSDAHPGDGVCADGDGHCTLRAAIQEVEASEVPGTITISFSLSTPATITVAEPLSHITAHGLHLAIQGPGSDKLTIDGNNAHRLFFISAAPVSVTISGLTIANGRTHDDGGAIYNASTLSLTDVQLRDNHSNENGGAIYNAGDATLTRVTLMGNRADHDGGAVFNDVGDFNIIDGMISGNFAMSGGGIYGTGVEGIGSVLLKSSTVSQNSATYNGGGIVNQNGHLQLTNSTVSGNSADNDAGGIYNDYDGTGATTSLASSTITDNDAGSSGGGIYNAEGAFEIQNSIIAGNRNNSDSSPDCASDGWSTFTAEYTLVGDDTGCDSEFNGGAGNLVGDAANPIDPGLGRLSKNGGASQTHALLTIGSGSPARDAADPAGCVDLDGAELTSDQRGAARVQDSDGDGIARCDMGAYESGLGNDTWTRALRLTLSGSATEPMAVISQIVDKPGQSRWYKFSVSPGNMVSIKLQNLPANYDITLYKDIQALYDSLITPNDVDDLVQLTAEFAPDAFSPDAFSPDAFSPDAFSPDAFSPDAFSPDAFSPDAFSPDAFSPDAFSPDAFSPDAFSPDAFSPDAFSPDLTYASAQIRSLIAVSAFDGLADEAITADTWDNSGDFYVRVRGRNGAFSASDAYDLEVTQFVGTCDGLDSALPPSNLTPAAGGYETIILTDLSRMDTSDPLVSTLQSRLAVFALRSEINGVVVNVGDDAAVSFASQQADTLNSCPTAKNLAAMAIKEIIDEYWVLNPNLKYVVVVGNDNVIPFFRYPDRALLANEKNFVPPVDDATTSYASLILGYILGQDFYGASTNLSVSNIELPVPNLPVGRLVETPADIIAVLDAYGATVTAGTPGQLPTPQTALVTGYDFLEDAAQAIQAALEAGIGTTADSIITPRDLSPLSDDPRVWTAADLRTQLLGSRHDVMFLAGHFSAHSALAADYQTRLLASEVASSLVDLQNVLVYSVGCHSGYNTVNEHGIPNVTPQPDWAQAFAQKGAILIAGTGYQYGDTDFLEYAERLYLYFSQELLVGSGPVAIGDALVAAKQTYLAETAQLRGIHEKTVLEATLFGLPMLSIDMPFGRNTPPTPPSIAGTPSTVALNPGNLLGLQVSNVTIPFNTVLKTVTLNSVSDSSTVTASYLEGADGTVTNPTEPALPLEIQNVSVPGTVLRGVGFRSGSYMDLPNITPLTGAATTEVRGVHPPFLSDVFFPIQPWRINYFGSLADSGIGLTRLNLTPAQFISDGSASATGILRQWQNMGLRLYYSNNVTVYAAGSQPATSAPLAITKVTATSDSDNVNFLVSTVGDLAAGVQEVWVTYTICGMGGCNGSWQSLDLTQNSTDSTAWEGALPLNGAPAGDILYMVQAVNGVGLVSMNTNLGAFFVPDIDPADLTGGGVTLSTSLAFQSAPASGAYNTGVSFSAQLTSEGTPLANQTIKFALGTQQRGAVTDSSGQATAAIPLLAAPGATDVRVTFAGNSTYQAAQATSSFTVLKQGTQLVLSPVDAVVQADDTATMTATLTDASGNRLREKSVFFIVTDTADPNGDSYVTSDITNLVSQAQLGAVPLPPGDYTVNVYFSGSIPLPTDLLLLTDPNYLPGLLSGTLRIEASNSPPIAIDDNYTIEENTTLTVAAPGVLDNDIDADMDLLSAFLESEPAHGTLQLNLDGSFVYIPVEDFTGSDSFTYRATDEMEDSNVANVTIVVTEVEDVFAICGGFEIFEISPGEFSAPSFDGKLIVGTTGDDWIIGTNGSDLILGLEGLDDIFGKNGNDVICGGSGVDIILGGNGQDTIFGGEGRDWLIGGSGSDYLDGGPGRDDLVGGNGQDVLYGGSGTDVLLGGRADDDLFGQDGRDFLYGLSGNDDLDGGTGIDFCRGGRGNDTVINCEGASAATIDRADADDIDEISALLVNDGEGEYTIVNRIHEIFLPLFSR